MIEDLRKWQTLIGKHDSLVWKLERSKVSKDHEQFFKFGDYISFDSLWTNWLHNVTY